MRPGAILDARATLLDRLQHDASYREQVAFMLAGHAGDVPMNAMHIKRPLLQEKVDKHLVSVDHLANHVKAAEVYRVTEDMSSMVEFAASQLDDSDAIDRSLAPTQCGIVRFDKPLPVKDIRGKMMLIHWMTWGPYRDQHGRHVTAVWAFNDPTSHPDDTHLEMRRVAQEDGGRGDWYHRWVGQFATVGVSFLFDGKAVGPLEMMASPKQMAEVLMEGFDPLPGTNDVRYIHALWLLLNQTVTRVEDEDVDRAARRRAGKMKLPSRVTVIRLRREVSSLGREPGESHVEWQHRWIVRGHWRWQAYGPGRTERRRIWINPFVKGPEGAPLKQSEKVYQLER